MEHIVGEFSCTTRRVSGEVITTDSIHVICPQHTLFERKTQVVVADFLFFEKNRHDNLQYLRTESFDSPRRATNKQEVQEYRCSLYSRHEFRTAF